MALTRVVYPESRMGLGPGDLLGGYLAGNMPVAQLWFWLLIAALVSPGARLQNTVGGLAAGTEFGGVAVGCEGMVVRPGRLLVSLSAGRRFTRWNRGSAGPPADSGGYGLVMVCAGLMA